MVKYLLDTNICIAWFKGEKSVQQRLSALAPDDILISTINLAELYFGAYNSERVEHNLDTLQKFVSEIQIVNLDTDSLEEYGKLKTALRKQGNIIDEFDLLIASICVANNFILVTNNEKHF
ncbi:MAG: PIN domain-containing protein, partial [bacterium]